jgi:hypothetical protein
LYFVKGKFGGKKFTLQKSKSTLQRSFCLLKKKNLSKKKIFGGKKIYLEKTISKNKYKGHVI